MDKSLASLVKALAHDYARSVELQRFNGMVPKVLHMRALRMSADGLIDNTKFSDYQNTLSGASLKDLDSK